MDKQSILYSFFKIELYFQYTADDCFELGRQCCKNEDYYHAVPWLEESLVKYQAETNTNVPLEEILDHLLFASNQLQGINKLLLHLYEMLFIISYFWFGWPKVMLICPNITAIKFLMNLVSALKMLHQWKSFMNSSAGF